MSYFNKFVPTQPKIDTTAIPPYYIVRIVILEKINKVQTELSRCDYQAERGLNINMNRFKVALRDLFRYIYSSLKNSYDRTSFTKLQNIIFHSDDYNKLQDSYFIMLDFLYAKGILLFDTLQKIDRTRVEEENLLHNL